MTKYLCLDFETSINTTVHGSTFRDPNNDIYTIITANHPDNVSVIHNPDGFKRSLDSVDLSDVDVIVGHNLSFDLCYVWHDEKLREFILRGGKIWDTQIAEYLLTGQQHQYASLAELQEKHLGEKEKPSRITYLYKKGIGADRIVQAARRCPRLWKLYNNEYCRTDGSTPLKILKKQYALAKAEGMLPIIELYNDYLLSIINMTCTGIHIDVVQTEKTYTEFMMLYLEYLEQAQNILKSVWTDKRLPEFNINSTIHKSAVLFGGNIVIEERQEDGVYKNGNPRFKKVSVSVSVPGLGVSPSLSIPMSKDGVYSTRDDIMQRIAVETDSYEVREYCKLQKQAMMHKKAAETYCKAFLDRNIDGVLYPNFNNVATKTSRLSSSEPNFQNIAKRNQFGKTLHRLFVAPPGWKCVQVDYSQLEIWVLAWLSKDPVLIKDLLSGIDMHCIRLQYYNQDKTYEELYHLCKEAKDAYWETERDKAKTLSYQKAYGAQAKKIAEETGLDIEVVKLIMEKEDERYKGGAALVKQVVASIESTASISLAKNIPASKKGNQKDSSKIINGVEMLPIFDKSDKPVYTEKDVRQVGYWRSPTGMKFHFLDTGRGKVSYRKQMLDEWVGVDGKLVQKYKTITDVKLHKRNFSFTQPKNYPMQGTGSNVQAISGAALVKALVSKPDVIRQVNEVHDSRWLYVREDKLDVVLPWIKKTVEDIPKLMLERFGLEVPFKFPVDIKVGDNFADMQTVEF